ncbi:MAG: hypothetical protein WC356_01760 [Candidatus Micrarchaeia archaeon]|jgi:hypothetical protein
MADQTELALLLSKIVLDLSDLKRDLAQGRSEMQSFKTMAQGVGESVKKAFAFAGVAVGIYEVVTALRDFAKDAAMVGARTETLAVGMELVGKNAGMSKGSLDYYVGQLKKLGITTQEAMNAVTRFVVSGMPLEKIEQLADVARNQAALVGKNTSEAFNDILTGIVTQQPEILRKYLLNIGLLSTVLGKSADSLDPLTRSMKVLNASLDAGQRSAGAYKAEMETVGKQLNSMARYAEEAKDALWPIFQPAMMGFVQEMTRGYKDLEAWAKANKERLAEWGKAGAEWVKWLATGIRDIGAFIAENKNLLKTLAEIYIANKAAGWIIALTTALKGASVAMTAAATTASGLQTWLLGLTANPWTIAIIVTLFGLKAAYDAISDIQKRATLPGTERPGFMWPWQVPTASQATSSPPSEVPGNIDIYHRPQVKNPDGSISTVRSMSFNEEDLEVLIPTVSNDARIMNDQEAIDYYHNTGQFLGKFKSIEQANNYAEWLHNQQAALIENQQEVSDVPANLRGRMTMEDLKESGKTGQVQDYLAAWATTPDTALAEAKAAHQKALDDAKKYAGGGDKDKKGAKEATDNLLAPMLAMLKVKREAELADAQNSLDLLKSTNDKKRSEIDKSLSDDLIDGQTYYLRLQELQQAETTAALAMIAQKKSAQEKAYQEALTELEADEKLSPAAQEIARQKLAAENKKTLAKLDTEAAQARLEGEKRVTDELKRQVEARQQSIQKTEDLNLETSQLLGQITDQEAKLQRLVLEWQRAKQEAMRRGATPEELTALDANLGAKQFDVKYGQTMNSIAGEFSSGVSNIINGIRQGTVDIGNTLIEMFNSIMMSALKPGFDALGTALTSAVKWLLNSLSGAMGGGNLFGGGATPAAAGGGGESLVGVSNAFSAANFSFQEMAAGGIAYEPTLAMIAEAGEPEVVSPLSDLKNFLSAGQSPTNVIVNNNAPNTQAGAETQPNGDVIVTVDQMAAKAYNRRGALYKAINRGGGATKR